MLVLELDIKVLVFAGPQHLHPPPHLLVQPLHPPPHLLVQPLHPDVQVTVLTEAQVVYRLLYLGQDLLEGGVRILTGIQRLHVRVQLFLHY